MTITKNFFAGYEYKGKIIRGVIYLNQIEFANFWQLDSSYRENAFKWVINRCGLALDMNLPISNYFNSLDDLMKWLQDWFDERQKT